MAKRHGSDISAQSALPFSTDAINYRAVRPKNWFRHSVIESQFRFLSFAAVCCCGKVKPATAIDQKERIKIVVVRRRPLSGLSLIAQFAASLLVAWETEEKKCWQFFQAKSLWFHCCC